MAQSSTLPRTFAPFSANGEDEVPGSGGNLNTVYDGIGSMETTPQDQGYQFGMFPAGAIPKGSEEQEFRISDSQAFSNLRGIAKTNFPFDPFPQTYEDKAPTSLADNFEHTGVALSTLMPGQYAFNAPNAELGEMILKEFEAGDDTLKSLPTGRSFYSVDKLDFNEKHPEMQYYGSGSTYGKTEYYEMDEEPKDIPELYEKASQGIAVDDVPVTPFHRQYPNFGAGEVDYGFNEPGADSMSEEIIRAYRAVLPEGQLAGAKKELMPVFSGVNQEAVEQRPILQSLGKIKNTLYLGGVTELPDDLRIDPREALMADGSIPADIVQTSGELASALGALGYFPGDPLQSGSVYGQRLPKSRTLAPNNETVPEGFYNHLTTSTTEPLVFEAPDNPYVQFASEVK